MIKLKYYIFLAISISILSLILSIAVSIKNNNVGRYQVCDYPFFVIDTKTSRLFRLSISLNRGIYQCIDYGTLENPQYKENIFNFQLRENFVTDKSEDEWETIPDPIQLRNNFVPDKSQGDIFDQIAPDN